MKKQSKYIPADQHDPYESIDSWTYVPPPRPKRKLRITKEMYEAEQGEDRRINIMLLRYALGALVIPLILLVFISLP